MTKISKFEIYKSLKELNGVHCTCFVLSLRKNKFRYKGPLWRAKFLCYKWLWNTFTGQKCTNTQLWVNYDVLHELQILLTWTAAQILLTVKYLRGWASINIKCPIMWSLTEGKCPGVAWGRGFFSLTETLLKPKHRRS